MPLAERMIKKFVEEKKIEAEAEVQLYLMVLERQVFLSCILLLPDVCNQPMSLSRENTMKP